MLLELLLLVGACSHGSPMTPCTKSSSSILHWLVLVPLPDDTHNPAFYGGHSIVPAVQLAVRQINEREDILPAHCVEITIGDSGCDKVSKAAVALVRNLFHNAAAEDNMRAFRQDKQVGGIIGPSCSEASVFLVKLLQRTGIIQLYSGTTPVLSNPDPRYKYSFGMISSSKVYHDALFRIADLNNWEWKNIALFYESSRKYYRETYQELLTRINVTQLGYVSPVIAPFFFPLDEIKRLNIRIVIALTSAQAARQLSCLAGHINFEYPIYQIIYTERILDNFLKKTDFKFTLGSDQREYVCNKQQILKGLNGSVFLRYSLDTMDPSLVTEPGYTIGQIREQYQEMLKEYAEEMNMTLSSSVYAYPYYDAAWSLALSINRTLNMVGSNLFSSGYEITDASEMLQSIIANISFQGVSTMIKFDNERHVTNNVDIFQVLDKQQMKMGYWNGSDNKVVIFNESVTTFIDNQFTIDYTKIDAITIGVGFAATLITLVFAVCLQIINTVMRESSAVKSNSPKLNHFIFVGSYLYIISIIFITIHMGFPKDVADTNLGTAVCNIIPLAVILGYSFIIGTIIAKLWRIYSIFRRTFDLQYLLEDKWLAAFILTNAVFTVIMYTPVLIWSPFHVDIIDITILLSDNSTPPTKMILVSCYNLSIPWLVIPPLLQQLIASLFAVMFAILNRKVKHKHFHDTVYINVLVYVLTFSVGIGASVLAILHVLRVNIDAFYAVYTVLLLFNVCTCLVVLVVRFLFL